MRILPAIRNTNSSMGYTRGGTQSVRTLTQELAQPATAAASWPPAASTPGHRRGLDEHLA